MFCRTAKRCPGDAEQEDRTNPAVGEVGSCVRVLKSLSSYNSDLTVSRWRQCVPAAGGCAGTSRHYCLALGLRISYRPGGEFVFVGAPCYALGGRNEREMGGAIRSSTTDLLAKNSSSSLSSHRKFHASLYGNFSLILAAWPGTDLDLCG